MTFWAAGAAIGGALITSSAAGDAADAQGASSAASIAEQRRQYDLNRSDQAGYMQTGNLANQKLRYMLGLGGAPGSTSVVGTGPAPRSPAEIRAALLSRFTKPGEAAGWYEAGGGSGPEGGDRMEFRDGTAGAVDETGLQAAINAEQGAQVPAEMPNDGSYGSLLKRFDTNDLNADPVYQSGLKFGLDQGTGAINARAIAGGGYDSGATLKALTKYANDYGSTKANESYNRYNTDQGNIFNRLSGVSGTGQVATGQVDAAGTSAAGAISGALTDSGNARAAGIVGVANAWNDALGGVNDAYQSYAKSQRLKKSMGSADYYSPVSVPNYDAAVGGY